MGLGSVAVFLLIIDLRQRVRVPVLFSWTVIGLAWLEILYQTRALSQATARFSAIRRQCVYFCGRHQRGIRSAATNITIILDAISDLVLIARPRMVVR